MKTKPFVVVLAVITALGILAAASVTWSEIHLFRARAPVRCHLRNYDFAHNGGPQQHRVASIIAAASADQLTSGPTRSFFVDQRTVQLEYFTLSRIALTIYESGQIAATGVVSHNGGPQAALLGGNLTIRVRAYKGDPRAVGAMLIADMKRRIWVPRNLPMAISLVPDVYGPRPAGDGRYRTFVQDINPPTGIVGRHFNDITHMEIILEYTPDP